MKKRFIAIFLLLVVGAGAFWLFYTYKNKEQPLDISPTQNAASTPPSFSASPTIKLEKPEQLEAQVWALVNDERKKAGLEPLMYDDELAIIARIRSEDFASTGTVSAEHIAPKYGEPHETLERFEYEFEVVAENLAYGKNKYTTAQEVVQAWMTSPEHKENILKDNVTHLGVGAYIVGDEIFWSQLFVKK